MYSFDNRKFIKVKIGDNWETSFDGKVANIEYKDGSTKFVSLKIKPLHEFDLINHDVYSDSGQLIKAQPQFYYDSVLVKKINESEPIYRCEDLLDYHYNKAIDKATFIKHIKWVTLPYNEMAIKLNEVSKDIILNWIAEKEKKIPQSKGTKLGFGEISFENLFYNPNDAEPCLEILRELDPPFIDAQNNYIGKSKGVFPLWISVLINHKPAPLIKSIYTDVNIKDALNAKIKGLNLTEDASEFRKHYVRLEKNKIELSIKTILSQFSQTGKLGK